MNTIHLLVFIIICLCIFASVIQTCPDYPIVVELDQESEELIDAYNQVDLMIQQSMESNGIQSFVASIVYDDQVVWSKGYGLVNPLDQTSPPITIDTPVRIASVTKVFTDLMMYQLRDDEVIDSLDDRVDKYNPYFSIQNPYPTKRGITLRQLASHQSGLPREVPCYPNEYETDNCTDQLIYERLSNMFLILPQYSTTHYSNLGVALLGQTLSIASQQPYTNYIQSNILEPLGMFNTTFSPSNVSSPIAIGLSVDNGIYTPTEIYPLGWADPAGGLLSTARDMSKFMSFWLTSNTSYQLSTTSSSSSSSSSILDSSTINEALTSVSLVNDGQTAYGTPFEMYYDPVNQIWLKSKLGIQNGYRSQMSLAPPYKLGVFFTAMLNFETQDVFTRQAMSILLPVYKSLIESQSSGYQSNNNNNIKHHKKHQSANNNKFTINPRIFIGEYGVNGTAYFGMAINKHGLLYSIVDGLIFNATAFMAEYPFTLRLQIANTEPLICKSVVDGYSYELAYFTLDPNNPNQCSSVQVFGLTLYRLSNDNNYTNYNNDSQKVGEKKKKKKK